MPKQINLTSSFKEYDSIDELHSSDKELLSIAIKAAINAYAPYSGFRVGAAVLLENGEIVTGNNQENAAYPSGLCAERVAVFSAAARYPGIKFLKIAVSTEKVKGPVSPCGACRQCIYEYEFLHESPIKIIMGSDEGSVHESASVANLLPLAFNNKNL